MLSRGRYRKVIRSSYKFILNGGNPIFLFTGVTPPFGKQYAQLAELEVIYAAVRSRHQEYDLWQGCVGEPGALQSGLSPRMCRMPYDLSDKLVIGISCALFDLEAENAIYEEGVDAYALPARSRERSTAARHGLPLVKALLQLNELIPERRLVEVVVISRNTPDTGLRAFNAIAAHKLDISRAAFTGGGPTAPYLQAFKIDLFLSRDTGDVQEAIDAGVAAARCMPPRWTTVRRTSRSALPSMAMPCCSRRSPSASLRRRGWRPLRGMSSAIARRP
jgi:hypothetical protein